MKHLNWAGLLVHVGVFMTKVYFFAKNGCYTMCVVQVKYHIQEIFEHLIFAELLNVTFPTGLFLNFRHFHHMRNHLVLDVLGMFTVESVVVGYHVFRRLWEASLDEELSCQREQSTFNLVQSIENFLYKKFP